MAIPPLNPLKHEETNISYFEKLALLSKDYLKEDNIDLNFSGYKETLKEYEQLTDIDTTKAWKLTKELNAWTEYFSSISNLIQKVYLDSETTKIEQQAIASIREDSVKVANGDRLANKDDKVVQARKKRNTLKAFYDELESKVKFLERAYYHCKSTCDWNTKNNNSINSEGN